jgi:hypothetical protein
VLWEELFELIDEVRGIGEQLGDLFIDLSTTSAVLSTRWCDELPTSAISLVSRW